MRKRAGLTCVLLLAAGIIAPLRVADAQGRPATATHQYSPEEIQAGRRRALESMMTDDGVGARWTRSACAAVDVVAGTARDHAAGNVMLPETVDDCLAAMTRQARDGQALTLHFDIMRYHNDNPAGYEAMPQRIADAIRAGGRQVTFGSKEVPITSGLALDTGFISAWTNQGTGAPGAVTNLAQLRAATESCLTQRADNKVCFTVGYVQGAAAFQAIRRSAAR